MKKLISLLLVVSMLCTVSMSGFAETGETSIPDFKGMSDPELLPYIEDTLYEELVDSLGNEDFFVENVNAVYVSQEYLDEVAYNSRANIFFGYTLADLDKEFQGSKYVFTLGDNGETIVEPFVEYDDTYEKIIRNVAVGAGVIIVCVTVSVVSAGAGAPAISMIFAVAAKKSAIGALSGAAIGGVSAGIITGMTTGDMEEALKAAALAGSEGFMWGAITGAISGGAGEAIALKGATLNGLTMDQAAIIQKESKYPLSVIKEFHSMEEYQIYKDAGLYAKTIGNKTALIRNIDLYQKDAFGRTNLKRMLNGEAALDPSGIAYEVHHVGQKNNSILAILTRSEHRGEGNFGMLHANLLESGVDHGAAFEAVKKQLWKSIAEILQ